MGLNFVRRTFALLEKNFWLFIRDFKATIIVFLSPFFFILLLYILQSIYSQELSKINSFPESSALSPIPICTSWGENDCITLLFTTSYAIPVMNASIISDSLRFGQDIHNSTEMGCKRTGYNNCIDMIYEDYDDYSVGGIGKEQNVNTVVKNVIEYLASHNTPPLTISYDQKVNADIVYYPNPEDLKEHIANNPNRTQNAIIFYLDPQQSLIGYNILYNTSRQAISTTAEVMRAIDESVISLFAGKESKISVTMQGFPLSTPQFLSDSVAEMVGVLFYICPIMLIFIILLNKITTEKQLQLRKSMKIAGLTDLEYWVSWFITAQFIYIISILLLIASGAIFQFDYFLKVNFFANFLSLYLFATAMIPILFICCILVTNTKQANLLGFFLFLSTFLLEMIFTDVAIYFWYSPAAPPIWEKIFRFYPPFNYAKCVADFTSLSYPYFSRSEYQFYYPPGYTWSDLRKDVWAPTIDITAPPTYLSFYYLLFDLVFYLVFVWYFDKVIKDNSGLAKEFYFFLTPSYWGIRCSRPNNTYERNDQSSSPLIELESIAETEENDKLIVKNLTKEFTIRSRKFSLKREKLIALDDLNLTIKNGTIMALLGHNGAGKSTFINLLTGAELPTSGSVSLFGLDLLRDSNAIRNIIGLCPQHDNLWEEFTVKQHIRFYANLKGIPRKEINNLITQKLEDVSLSTSGNKKARELSGGMRRRLSVAISTIGDPKIIFLDEPTTGLDPINKRSVWELIKKLKNDRILILTTHSMDEANFLSDLTAILSHGQLKALGSNLYLKNTIGNSFKLNLVCRPENAEYLSSLIAEYPLLQAKLIRSNAGSLMFTIEKNSLIHLHDLFNYLNDKDLSSILLDWSLSHSSLEEIFHIVTDQ